MVTKLCPNGDVRKFLTKNQWNQTLGLRLLFETAMGMTLLHSRDILHGDLKSLNVLVDENGTARIADFGLAKIRKDSGKHNPGVSVFQGPSGTPGFMAPELYEESLKKPADVFAFAMTVYEVVSRGRWPFEEATSQVQIMKWVTDGKRPDKPHGTNDHLWNLMQRMWQNDPFARPTFPQIVDEMKRILQSVVSGGGLPRPPSTEPTHMAAGAGNPIVQHPSYDFQPPRRTQQQLAPPTAGQAAYMRQQGPPIPPRKSSAGFTPTPAVPPRRSQVPQLGQPMPLQNTKLSSLMSAANAGDAVAMNDLGVVYFSGSDGVPQDYAQAVYWFSRASQMNNAAAQNNLGWSYLQGHGVSVNPGAAKVWFEKAAEQGNVMAEFNLGVYYEKYDVDLRKAYTWYQRGTLHFGHFRKSD